MWIPVSYFDMNPDVNCTGISINPYCKGTKVRVGKFFVTEI